MNERIRIPILEGMSSSFGSERPFDHITREIELETKRNSVSVKFDRFESYKNPDLGHSQTIAAQFHEAVHTDRVKKETQSSVSFTSVPKGIRASILCRMFGENGEEAPQWWPEWLRAKVKPRMKEIMTSHHSKTEIHYQRVCPHQGEQGHGNFLFGPELTFADRRMKNDLYAAAERSRGDDFMEKIYDLINACRRNAHEPSLISLGRREMSLLLRSDRYGDMLMLTIKTLALRQTRASRSWASRSRKSLRTLTSQFASHERSHQSEGCRSQDVRPKEAENRKRG